MPSPSSPTGETAITLQRVLRAVRRRLNLMLAVLLLTFSAVAVFSFQFNDPIRQMAIAGGVLFLDKALTRTDQRYPGVDRVVAKPTPGRVG